MRKPTLTRLGTPNPWSMRARFAEHPRFENSAEMTVNTCENGSPALGQEPQYPARKPMGKQKSQKAGRENDREDTALTPALQKTDVELSPKASGSPRPRSEMRLENLRRVVLQLVADRGIEGVTIDAIAMAAQASKQTLYKRWPTKSELIRDAIRMSFDGAHPGDPGDLGSLREELRLILESAAAMLRTNRRLIIALIDGAQRDPIIMALMRQETRENFRESLQRPMKRAIARGEIRPETDLNIVSEIALPVLLHRAMLDEIIDDRVVRMLLDDVLMKLVSK
ncbi:TetR/AcrR family transcriptional regulator [Burkholderia sp. MR1-5-21]